MMQKPFCLLALALLPTLAGTASAQAFKLEFRGDQMVPSAGCESPVFVHCPNSTAILPDTPDSFSAAIERAKRRLDARRQALSVSNDTPDIGTVVIHTDRPGSPKDRQWEDFGISIEQAAVEDCLSPQGASAGLLNIILVPLKAAAGRCR